MVRAPGTLRAPHAPATHPPSFADINKFLWMVRIGGSTDTGRHIKEHDYYTPTGEFRVDREGSPVLLNCLMYKMCYYRFGQVYTEASACPVLRCRVPAAVGPWWHSAALCPHRAAAGLRPRAQRRDREQGL